MPADSIASPKLSILMPAYNEEATIVPAVERVMSTSLPVAFELVVVDDGSSDRTASLLGELQRSHEFQLVRHATNKGKGAALLTALAAANGDVCTVLDADLELDPKDIAPMYRELLDGGADLVLGVRSLGRASGQTISFRYGNRFLTWIASRLLGRQIGDLMTCQKMMRTEFFRSLCLRETGFAIEAEIVARTVHAGGEIALIGVEYHAREASEGKKIARGDGLKVLETLVRCRYGTGSRGTLGGYA